MTTELYGPVVNLNGADRKSLVDQHVAVAEAARELLNKLIRAAPHGRDYQTAAAGTHSKDDALFREMYLKVDQIERTYQRIAERLYTEDQ